MAYKVFSNGNTLPASDINTYLMNQTVMVFASSTARTAALTPTEGMITYLEDTNALEDYTGTAWATVGVDSTITNALLVGPKEKSTVSATAATGTINYDLTTQADVYYTTSASANFTLNFRASSTVALNTLLATGESISAVFRNTNGATAYYPNVIQVDGASQTVKWQGGTAVSAGNASAVDVYTFVITKTGSATFTVFGSQVKFA